MRYIAMGENYYSKEGLVRTVCRAYNDVTNEAHIAYVRVGAGGLASEVYFTSEENFRNRFIKE